MGSKPDVGRRVVTLIRQETSVRLYLHLHNKTAVVIYLFIYYNYFFNLQAPLFRGLNPGFKRMLSLVIRPVFYMPNQIIASKGDIGHHMFYIHRGRLEVCLFNNFLTTGMKNVRGMRLSTRA